MTVKVVMPVRDLNLVEPLPHEGTATRTTETAARAQDRPGAVSALIDPAADLRGGDVDSSMLRSTRPTTRGCRTSATATATSTTRTTSSAPSLSADSSTKRCARCRDQFPATPEFFSIGKKIHSYCKLCVIERTNELRRMKTPEYRAIATLTRALQAWR